MLTRHRYWAFLLVLGCWTLLPGCGSATDDAATETALAAAEGDAVAETGTKKKGKAAPRVVLTTPYGDITLELDRANTPLTVSNFLDYVKSGHYDQTIFHQVEPGYMILGGGYTAELEEKEASYAIRNEAHKGLKNNRGTIAMAREPDAVDSGRCQFFINVADNPHLDYTGRDPETYGYCVFGKVVAGMDVVDKIAEVDAQDTEEFPKLPVETVMIESARVLK